MRTIGKLILVTALLTALPALAAKTKHAKAKPAATTDATAAAPTTADPGVGTTIIGDQEAPIGLYITPWKNDYAEHSLDRPARFVDDELVPIDPDVFHREIEFDTAITKHRKAQLANSH